MKYDDRCAYNDDRRRKAVVLWVLNEIPRFALQETARYLHLKLSLVKDFAAAVFYKKS